MPKRKKQKASATTSSVAIQVSRTETVITTCTSTTPIVSSAANADFASSQGQDIVEMVRPGKDFLHLLRSAGADGDFFTRKEVLYFLKEYISSKKLYDPCDPGTVHCEKDQLGQVFGCSKFTISDVLPLLSAHIEPVMPCTQFAKKQKTPAAQEQNRKYVMMHRQQEKVKASNLTAESVIGVQPLFVKDSNHNEDHLSKSKSSQAQVRREERENTSGKRERKRKREKSSSSKSSSASRARQSSISITYSSDGEGKFPWYYQVQVQTSDENKSEVLSIQGYETAVIQDSEDDLWYMEISSDGGFSVEYEVGSDTSHGTAGGGESGDSDEFEDIVVVCNDSDIEFWADSSDVESTSGSDGSDMEISQDDKWRCGECDMLNSPFQRYCDRCWKLRPGWLPDRHSQQNRLLRRSISAPVEMTGEEMEQVTLNNQQLYITYSNRRKNSSSNEDFGRGKSFSSATRSPPQQTNSKQNRCASSSDGSKNASGNKPGTQETCIKLPSSDSVAGKVLDSEGSNDTIVLEDDEPTGTVMTAQQQSESSGYGSIGPWNDSIKSELTVDQANFVGSSKHSSLSHNIYPAYNDVIDLTQGPLEYSSLKPEVCCGTDVVDGPTSNEVFKSVLNDHGGSVCSGIQVGSKPMLPGLNVRRDSVTVVTEQRNGVDVDVIDQPVSHDVIKSTSNGVFNVTDRLNVNEDKDNKSHDNYIGAFQQSASSHLQGEDTKKIGLASLSARPCTSGAASDSFNSHDDVTQKPEYEPPGTTTDNCSSKTTLPLLHTTSSKHETAWKECPKSDKTSSAANRSDNSHASGQSTATGGSSGASIGTSSLSGGVIGAGPSGAGQPGPSRVQQPLGNEYNDLCVICMSKPKEASIIHGKTGHQVTCYSCAKRLKWSGRPCPICRRPIQKVIKNFLM
ncbi:protein Mdm4 [Lingula anatina]|uniref:Protein Mdm4 n=1 Tax=Lingula anatina TaxID=7574 RepID=A0A1S3KAV1_LINAN|nr:protein Mdm4 [Lingula anatina]XP_013419774.1 protein Mdm4 [Lingula anatina]|eukprot:XP_013419773.1 protein Mdm4 [Lingula anatina]